MQGLAVVLFPAVLMLFALAMERVQTRLDRLSVSQGQVEEFLQSADSAELDTLAKEGFPAALDELRTRRADDRESRGRDTGSRPDDENSPESEH